MRTTYAVLGAGRQGAAAVYDIGHWGQAQKVILADCNSQLAECTACRINDLLGNPLVEARCIEANDRQAVDALLGETDAFLSAVPYYYNLELTRAALQAGVH